MFVGLVRGASDNVGFCWMLSGGSQLCSAVTNSSKYRYVNRDSFFRNSCCSSESCLARTGSGRLIHHARAGESAHETRKGDAREIDSGWRMSNRHVADTASNGAAAIERYAVSSSPRAARSASLAVLHSSN